MSRCLLLVEIHSRRISYQIYTVTLSLLRLGRRPPFHLANGVCALSAIQNFPWIQSVARSASSSRLFQSCARSRSLSRSKKEAYYSGLHTSITCGLYAARPFNSFCRNIINLDSAVSHTSITFSVKPMDLPSAVLELELFRNDVSIAKTSGMLLTVLNRTNKSNALFNLRALLCCVAMHRTRRWLQACWVGC